ncbi:serine/threonine-protein kinase [Streptomyces radicis]|uniref:Serine/threonine protein kinase n=1 Tax=Streptomyces radicis TaxID=1750517 RepID=A0A3A9W4L9_9ACTN|nr:serine/threonine-protein kinase [Streptomyces radicis]RKN08195.1 serine/threonine protein kinase [Streptomyces radicis]RKN20550.1 serine/threonine protein kinase [Streptomyces radicis]
MEAGEVLDDRYQIEEALDQGGMGSIWTATDLSTGDRVAVKVLRFDAYTQGRFSPAERARRRAELLKRFEREGAILEELNHPGVPRLLHRGYLSEEPYLVMEYVDGVSLREFLDLRRPFPFDAAISIAVQVAEALGHAHTCGVVHRDLKPGNIVVGFGSGAVKLLDFGIAYLTDPDATRYTALGDTPGTVGYMAPEQRRGQQDISAAVDLYAFGCVLFELLTGERPFEDKPDRNKDIQHLEDLPPRLRSINLGIPEELDELVWDLLAKAPADRPDSIDEVLDVLRGFLPRPGDPAPDPQLDPDPTAPYRMPNKEAAGVGAVPSNRPAASRRSARRRGDWLGRNQFAGGIALARAELLARGPGDRCTELVGLLSRAESDWGDRDPMILEGRLVCADADRLDGRTADAKRRYEQVADRGDPSDPLVMEAELGIAECRMPQGDFVGAFHGWRAAVERILTYAPTSEGLTNRCREIALELGESGYQAEVAELLSQLPES